VYSRSGAPELAKVAVVLGAPATAAAAYRFDGRLGHIAPGAFAKETRDVCIPPHAYAEFTLRGLSSSGIPVAPVSFAAKGTRLVGVRVGPITAGFTGKPC